MLLTRLMLADIQLTLSLGIVFARLVLDDMRVIMLTRVCILLGRFARLGGAVPGGGSGNYLPGKGRPLFVSFRAFNGLWPHLRLVASQEGAGSDVAAFRPRGDPPLSSSPLLFFQVSAFVYCQRVGRDEDVTQRQSIPARQAILFFPVASRLAMSEIGQDVRGVRTVCQMEL